MADQTYQEQGAQDSSSEQEAHGHSGGHGTLTLSANDFNALEERVMRAVEVVRRERQIRMAAEERATQAEAKLHDRQSAVEELEKELSVLRAEREHVRERVERLLGQLDTLEL